MTTVRDATIDEWRDILSGKMKGETATAVRATIGPLGPVAVSSFSTLIPQIVDTVLHNLLFSLEQSRDLALTVDEDGELKDVKQISDGLAGELYGQNGWIARFSNES